MKMRVNFFMNEMKIKSIESVELNITTSKIKHGKFFN